MLERLTNSCCLFAICLARSSCWEFSLLYSWTPFSHFLCNSVENNNRNGLQHTPKICLVWLTFYLCRWRFTLCTDQIELLLHILYLGSGLLRLVLEPFRPLGLLLPQDFIALFSLLIASEYSFVKNVACLDFLICYFVQICPVTSNITKIMVLSYHENCNTMLQSLIVLLFASMWPCFLHFLHVIKKALFLVRALFLLLVQFLMGRGQVRFQIHVGRSHIRRILLQHKPKRWWWKGKQSPIQIFQSYDIPYAKFPWCVSHFASGQKCGKAPFVIPASSWFIGAENEEVQ